MVTLLITLSDSNSKFNFFYLSLDLPYVKDMMMLFFFGKNLVISMTMQVWAVMCWCYPRHPLFFL